MDTLTKKHYSEERSHKLTRVFALLAQLPVSIDGLRLANKVGIRLTAHAIGGLFFLAFLA